MKKSIPKISSYLFLILSILILIFAVWFSFGKYQQKKRIEDFKKQIQARWGQTIPGGVIPAMPK